MYKNIVENYVDGEGRICTVVNLSKGVSMITVTPQNGSWLGIRSIKDSEKDLERDVTVVKPRDSDDYYPLKIVFSKIESLDKFIRLLQRHRDLLSGEVYEDGDIQF